VFNAAPEPIAVTPPKPPAGGGWTMLVNTATMTLGATLAAGARLAAPGRSVLVFAEAV
jgi:hypothetical protein